MANEALNTEKQILLPLTAIQEMVNGTFTNHGFVTIADNELNDIFNYKASNAANKSHRPKLVIQCMPLGQLRLSPLVIMLAETSIS